MRTRTTIRNASRRGFTLVELLVAAALSILIMAVIAVAFQTGLQTLSTIKSLGDMAERLKTSETLLRNDLEAEHFETIGSGDNSPGVLRVSDLRYHVGGSNPPVGGYLQIFQGQPSDSSEGNDADGLLSSRADGVRNHRISMTVKRKGMNLDQFFVGDLSQLTVPAEKTAILNQSATNAANGTSQFVTRWGQVDWFLANPTTINGVSTWALYRRARAVGATATSVTGAQDTLSVTPSAQLATMASLANPANRVGTGQNAVPLAPASPYFGDDIVITNVLSFEVRPVYVPGTGVAPANADGIFADLPGATNMNFDTGLGTQGNNRIRVMGVQVKIRVYDPKNKLARQTTLVVKL